MEQGVVDSSALLAALLRESGEEIIAPVLPRLVLSAVNSAESQARLLRNGVEGAYAAFLVHSFIARVVPFTETQAAKTATLISQTMGLNISFADCACLALAWELGAPVYTADRALERLDVGIEVRLIR